MPIPAHVSSWPTDPPPSPPPPLPPSRRLILLILILQIGGLAKKEANVSINVENHAQKMGVK